MKRILFGLMTVLAMQQVNVKAANPTYGSCAAMVASDGASLVSYIAQTAYDNPEATLTTAFAGLCICGTCVGVKKFKNWRKARALANDRAKVEAAKHTRRVAVEGEANAYFSPAFDAKFKKDRTVEASKLRALGAAQVADRNSREAKEQDLKAIAQEWIERIGTKPVKTQADKDLARALTSALTTNITGNIEVAIMRYETEQQLPRVATTGDSDDESGLDEEDGKKSRPAGKTSHAAAATTEAQRAFWANASKKK